MQFPQIRLAECVCTTSTSRTAHFILQHGVLVVALFTTTLQPLTSLLYTLHYHPPSTGHPHSLSYREAKGMRQQKYNCSLWTHLRSDRHQLDSLGVDRRQLDSLGVDRRQMDSFGDDCPQLDSLVNDSRQLDSLGDDRFQLNYIGNDRIRGARIDTFHGGVAAENHVHSGWVRKGRQGRAVAEASFPHCHSRQMHSPHRGLTEERRNRHDPQTFLYLLPTHLPPTKSPSRTCMTGLKMAQQATKGRVTCKFSQSMMG
ncbi:hypothetical protein E2C01_037687 [Portunus trituberculatus]|uniref:Uncharacterized protein n=1 Tax=Portunus trituberculatus TaxID=210409 RepID=A0A5B7FGH1_PORTR|nr:hypothetical protein [Portunus trituberculatus]